MIRTLIFLAFGALALLILATLFLMGPPTRPVPTPGYSVAVQQLWQIRQAEDEVLESYGWVDREENIARIPIHEAMNIVAERGTEGLFAPEAPEAPDVAVFSLSLPEDSLPEEATVVTVVVREADGTIRTETISMPAAIERVELAAAPEEVDEVEEEEEFDWQALGEEVYTGSCAACHQANGEGVAGVFPPLAGHAPELYNPDGGRVFLIDVVLYGLQGEIVVEGQTYDGVMPPWPQLTDEQIAAVLNHIVTAWDNEELLEDFEPYTPQEVEEERGKDLTPADVYALRQDLDLE